MALSKSYTLTNISSKCFASGLFAVVLKNVNSIFSYFFDFKAILRWNFRIVKKILLSQLLSRAISIFCSNSGKIADPSAGGVINKNVVKSAKCKKRPEWMMQMKFRNEWKWNWSRSLLTRSNQPRCIRCRPQINQLWHFGSLQKSQISVVCCKSGLSLV